MKKMILFGIFALTLSAIVSAGITVNQKETNGGGGNFSQVVCETYAFGSGRVSVSQYLPYLGSMAYSPVAGANYKVGVDDAWIASFKSYGYIVSGTFPFNENPSCQLRIGTTVEDSLDIGLSLLLSANSFAIYDKNEIIVNQNDVISAYYSSPDDTTTIGIGCQVVMCYEI